MAEESGRSVEEWQALLEKMFPQAVQVVYDGEDTPAYLAKPVRVSTDYDTKQIQWVLGISESHAEYIPLDKAEVKGTELSVIDNGKHAIIRARGAA